MISSDRRFLIICTSLIVLLFAHRVPAEDSRAKPAPEFADVPALGTVHFAPTDAELQVPERFRLKAHDFEYRMRTVRTVAKTRFLRVTFPSPVTTDVAENNTVYGEYFQPAGPGPFPACVVLHILGGDFLLAETVAAHLASRGIAALFVKMPYYGPRRGKDSPKRMISEDPRETVIGMTQGVLDIRRATAWLAERSEVDANRLGITGISLGGIMSALAAAGEPRLSNVAIVLGGGNFAEFLWANPTDRAVRFRERWLAAGETQETFRDVVSQIDPVTYGPLLKGRRVLMIAAANDEIITPSSSKALWESIGREPELVWLEGSHYTAIKFLPRELVRLDMFFNGHAGGR